MQYIHLLMQGIDTAKRFTAGTELVNDSRFPYCYLIRGWKSRKIEDTWMKILAKFKQTQFSSLLKNFILWRQEIDYQRMEDGGLSVIIDGSKKKLTPEDPSEDL